MSALPRFASRNRPRASAFARAERAGRPICLLTTLHPERALARPLAQHLAEELPDIAFTLRDGPLIDVLWVCGYEPGNAALIHRLRGRHPQAVFLVTAKQPTELWAGEVLAAGADHALSWPIELAQVARVLLLRPLQRLA